MFGLFIIFTIVFNNLFEALFSIFEHVRDVLLFYNSNFILDFTLKKRKPF